MITFAELQQTEDWQNYAEPAQSFYDPGLPYHNWEDHVLPAVESVIAFANRCERRGIRLPVGRLAVSMAWHDAGAHEDPLTFGFDTAEKRSADLARRHLKFRGAKPDYIAKVRDDILGTQAGMERRTPAQIVMHWADVSNIGASFEQFATASARLLRERRLTQPDLTFAAYVDSSVAFIEELAEEANREFKIIGEPAQGLDSFPVAARDNARQLRLITEAELLEQAA